MRDSFVFYRSFFESIDELPIENQAHIYKAIASYALNGEIVALNQWEGALFKTIRPQLDANQKRYESGCKGGKYGKLGGRPKKTPTKPPNNPTQTPNDNVNDNVNVNDNGGNIPPGECAHIGGKFNEEFLSFCSKWGISIDTNSSLIADLDFEKLDKAYSESETLLQDKDKAPYAHMLSWIVKNASSICAGKYKDRITNSNAQSNGGIIDGWSELYFKYKNEETS